MAMIIIMKVIMTMFERSMGTIIITMSMAIITRRDTLTIRKLHY